MKHWKESDVVNVCKSCDFKTHSLPIYKRHMRRCTAAATAAGSNTDDDDDETASTASSSGMVSGSQNLKCNKCDFMTTNSAVLSVHRFEAHDENQCNLCKYSARFPGVLICHYRDFHKLADNMIDQFMGTSRSSSRKRSGLKPNSSQSEAQASSIEDDKESSDSEDETPISKLFREGNDDSEVLLNKSTSSSLKRSVSKIEVSSSSSVVDEKKSKCDLGMKKQMFCPNKSLKLKCKQRDSDSEPKTSKERNSLGVSRSDSNIQALDESLVSNSSAKISRRSKSEASLEIESGDIEITFKLPTTHLSTPSKYSSLKSSKSKSPKSKAVWIFLCDLCSFKAGVHRLLLDHRRTVHGTLAGLIYKCNECNYETKLRRNYQQHWVRHTQKQAFKCYCCSFSSSNEGAVRRHILKYHPESSDEGEEAENVTENSVDESIDSSKVSKYIDIGAENGMDIESITPEDESECMKLTPNSIRRRVSLKSCVSVMKCKSPSKATSGSLDLNVDCDNSVSIEVLRTDEGFALRRCVECDIIYVRFSDMNQHTLTHHSTALKDCAIIKLDCNDTAESSVRKSLRSSATKISDESGGDRNQDNGLSPNKPIKCAHCSFITYNVDDIQDHLSGAIEGKYLCGFRPTVLSTIEKSAKPGKFQNDNNDKKGNSAKKFGAKVETSSPRSLRRSVDSVTTSLFSHETEKTYAGRKHRTTSQSEAKSSASVCDTAAESSQKASLHAEENEDESEQADKFDSSNDIIKQKSESKSAVKVKCLKRQLDIEMDEDSLPSSYKKLKILNENGEINMDYLLRLMCKFCGYFGSPGEVAKHTRIHTGEKPYWCSVCSYKTTWKGDLKKHMQKNHFEVSADPDMLSELVNASYHPGETENGCEIANSQTNLNENSSNISQEEMLKTLSTQLMQKIQSLNKKETVVKSAQLYKILFESIKNHNAELNLSSKNGEEIECGKASASSTIDMDGIVDVVTNVKSAPDKLNHLTVQNSESETVLENSSSQLEESDNLDKEMETEERKSYLDAPRYRPFVCSVCRRRSNWKWDLKKHIESKHDNGSIIRLSDEEAKSTYEAYMTELQKTNPEVDNKPVSKNTLKPLKMISKKDVIKETKDDLNKSEKDVKVSESVLSKENSVDDYVSVALTCDADDDDSGGSAVVEHQPIKLKGWVTLSFVPENELEADPTIGWTDSLRLRRFKCSMCAYRTSFRSDMERHFKNIHRNRKRCTTLVLTRECAEATASLHKPHTKQGERKLRGIENQPGMKRSAGEAELNTTEKSTDLCSVIKKREPDEIETARLRLKQEADDNKYCDICPYVTDKDAYLKLHLSYHQPSTRNKYKCHYCPYYVRTARLLNSHLQLHLSKSEAEAVAVGRPAIAPPTSNKPAGKESNSPPMVTSSKVRYRYICDKCPFTSFVRNDYWLHRRNHFERSDDQVRCPRCPYWVDDQSQLSQHTRLHAGVYCPRMLPYLDLPENCFHSSISIKTELIEEDDCRCVYSSKNLSHLGISLGCSDLLYCPYCSFAVHSVLLMREHYAFHVSATDASFTKLFDPMLDIADHFLSVPCKYSEQESPSEYVEQSEIDTMSQSNQESEYDSIADNVSHCIDMESEISVAPELESMLKDALVDSGTLSSEATEEGDMPVLEVVSKESDTEDGYTVEYTNTLECGLECSMPVTLSSELTNDLNVNEKESTVVPVIQCNSDITKLDSESEKSGLYTDTQTSICVLNQIDCSGVDPIADIVLNDESLNDKSRDLITDDKPSLVVYDLNDSSCSPMSNPDILDKISNASDTNPDKCETELEDLKISNSTEQSMPNLIISSGEIYKAKSSDSSSSSVMELQKYHINKSSDLGNINIPACVEVCQEKNGCENLENTCKEMSMHNSLVSDISLNSLSVANGNFCSAAQDSMRNDSADTSVKTVQRLNNDLKILCNEKIEGKSCADLDTGKLFNHETDNGDNEDCQPDKNMFTSFLNLVPSAR